MPILSSEIKFYKPDVNDDTAANGGRMTAVEMVSGLMNNLFPDVPEAERTAGSTKYRKRFVKIENDLDLMYKNAKLCVGKHTPGDDAVVVFPGTQRDTQNDLTGSERLYGAGQLAADVTAGASSITVDTEGASLAYFQDGDLIMISDKPSVNDPSGNREFVRLAASGGVAWNGDQATLTLAANLANSYLAANTVVASVIEHGDVAASSDNWIESSASGVYDEVTYPPVLDHVGGIEQTWTLTFTSPTAFDVVGDTVGSVGSGNTGADFIPTNPDFTKPYFTLLSAGWGGTWQAGDTIVFQTHPAAIPVWYKRIVPAGAASLSDNKVITAVAGESA